MKTRWTDTFFSRSQWSVNVKAVCGDDGHQAVCFLYYNHKFFFHFNLLSIRIFCLLLFPISHFLFNFMYFIWDVKYGVAGFTITYCWLTLVGFGAGIFRGGGQKWTILEKFKQNSIKWSHKVQNRPIPSLKRRIVENKIKIMSSCYCNELISIWKKFDLIRVFKLSCIFLIKRIKFFGTRQSSFVYVAALNLVTI